MMTWCSLWCQWCGYEPRLLNEPGHFYYVNIIVHTIILNFRSGNQLGVWFWFIVEIWSLCFHLVSVVDFVVCVSPNGLYLFFPKKSRPCSWNLAVFMVLLSFSGRLVLKCSKFWRSCCQFPGVINKEPATSADSQVVFHDMASTLIDGSSSASRSRSPPCLPIQRERPKYRMCVVDGGHLIQVLHPAERRQEHYKLRSERVALLLQPSQGES